MGDHTTCSAHPRRDHGNSRRFSAHRQRAPRILARGRTSARRQQCSTLRVEHAGARAGAFDQRLGGAYAHASEHGFSSRKATGRRRLRETSSVEGRRPAPRAPGHESRTSAARARSACGAGPAHSGRRGLAERPTKAAGCTTSPARRRHEGRSGHTEHVFRTESRFGTKTAQEAHWSLEAIRH